MPNAAHYHNPAEYEGKLLRVLERMGGTLVDYEYTGRSRIKRGEVPTSQRPQVATVTFTRPGADGPQFYSLRHTPEQSAHSSVPVTSGPDLFCQLVLALEKIAQLGELGISQLGVDAALQDARALVPAELPAWCRALGLDALPQTEGDVAKAFRGRLLVVHPDVHGTGSALRFAELIDAKEHALTYLATRRARTEAAT